MSLAWYSYLLTHFNILTERCVAEIPDCSKKAKDFSLSADPKNYCGSFFSNRFLGDLLHDIAANDREYYDLRMQNLSEWEVPAAGGNPQKIDLIQVGTDKVGLLKRLQYLMADNEDNFSQQLRSFLEQDGAIWVGSKVISLDIRHMRKLYEIKMTGKETPLRNIQESDSEGAILLYTKSESKIVAEGVLCNTVAATSGWKLHRENGSTQNWNVKREMKA
ncbi:hypothetical protein SARC_00031 [Sphaeroforma arctica JP610]|uniref:Uncharacterized protein n=1 Tax=Sphaeroforma arctica JP610 TaxID=667725 RepID=A0A0L0GG96_9EUKA|nr:hypothetical protein SARC_00031 [Sphaeroforma arctica JP610]KNC87899.1 hypothetical protein SARC_00031 [Sphaeroforma arctica JP610]|eukprot:XP_014161801.1 hypothetical protein SARC_00031 [Sphaeroforma arctica JP610]